VNESVDAGVTNQAKASDGYYEHTIFYLGLSSRCLTMMEKKAKYSTPKPLWADGMDSGG